MSNIAFIYPGQGAQAIGMGQEFYQNTEIGKKLFTEANEVLGFSLSNLCFTGPVEELGLTTNTQPALLVVSVIASQLVTEEGITPSIVGGHSLGEYSALVAAGVIDFKDAVALVQKRGRYMQEAVPVGEGSMAAILGVERDKVKEIADTVTAAGKEYLVQAVNFNCPGQTVIAGTTAGVEKAAEELKGLAKKTVILPVSAPFHSDLMEPAADKLKLELDKIEFRDAKIPVVSNVTAKIQTKAAEIKESLILQAKSPVLWEDCVAAMIEYGATTFLEAGPGKTLASFNRRIDKTKTCYNVSDMATLEKTLAALKEA